MTLIDALAAAAGRDGGRPFLRWWSAGGEQVTVSYRSQLLIAGEVAGWLAGRGVRAGARVVAVLPNGPDLVHLWYGAAAAGAMLVPLDPRLTTAELAALIGHTRPKLVVAGAISGAAPGLSGPGLTGPGPTGRGAAGPGVAVPDAAGLGVAGLSAVPAGDAELVTVGGRRPGLADLACGAAPGGAAGLAGLAGAAGPRSPVAVLYTSGSTGRPKGAVLTHDSLTLPARQLAARLGLTADDVLLGVLPLHHMAGLSFLSAAVATGACTALRPRFSGRRFWPDAVAGGATVVRHLGEMLAVLCHQPPGSDDRRHRLRLAYGAGAGPAVAARFTERFGVPTVQGYGLSETNTVLCGTPGAPAGTLGTPLPHVRVRLVDGGAVVAGDGAGELQVHRNPAMMAGYLAAPELTADAFDGPWFRTGDLVRRDPDGHLRFVARIKDVIRRRGENIDPADVERAAESTPGVRRAAAIAVPGEFGGAEIQLFAEADPASDVTPAAVRASCAALLAEFKRPRFVTVVPRLPLTHTAKIDKPTLRRWAAAEHLTPPAPPLPAAAPVPPAPAKGGTPSARLGEVGTPTALGEGSGAAVLRVAGAGVVKVGTPSARLGEVGTPGARPVGAGGSAPGVPGPAVVKVGTPSARPGNAGTPTRRAAGAAGGAAGPAGGAAGAAGGAAGPAAGPGGSGPGAAGLAERLAALAELARTIERRAAELAELALNTMPFPHAVVRADIALAVRRLAAFGSLVPPLRRRRPVGTVALCLPGNAIMSNPVAAVGASFLAGNRTMVRLPASRREWSAELATLLAGALGDAVLMRHEPGRAFVEAVLNGSAGEGTGGERACAGEGAGNGDSAGNRDSAGSGHSAGSRDSAGNGDTGRVGALMIFGDDRWAAAYEPLVRRARTRLVFEGPGKDPFLVLDPALAVPAAAAAAAAGLYNAGQACTAPERIYVLARAYPEFLDALVAAVERLPAGHPADPDTRVGPLTTAGAERVLGQLADAEEAGAKVLTGGTATTMTVNGEPRVLVTPAVVAGANHGMALLREETFGPVLPVVPVSSPQEAVALAEDSRYGLSATVYGGPDWVRARLAASHGEVFDGETWLDRRERAPVAPYGGRRQSGWVWEWREEQFIRRDGPRRTTFEFSDPATDV